MKTFKKNHWTAKILFHTFHWLPKNTHQLVWYFILAVIALPLNIISILFFEILDMKEPFILKEIERNYERSKTERFFCLLVNMFFSYFLCGLVFLIITIPALIIDGKWTDCHMNDIYILSYIIPLTLFCIGILIGKIPKPKPIEFK